MTFLADYTAFASTRPDSSPQSSHRLAPDCAGLDFFALDTGLQDLLDLSSQAGLAWVGKHLAHINLNVLRCIGFAIAANPGEPGRIDDGHGLRLA